MAGERDKDTSFVESCKKRIVEKKQIETETVLVITAQSQFCLMDLIILLACIDLTTTFFCLLQLKQKLTK